MSARRERDSGGGGMSLRLKFALSMTVALAVVMGAAGYLLNRGIARSAASSFEKRMGESVVLTATEGRAGNYKQEGRMAVIVPGTEAKRFSVQYGLLDGRSERAMIYEADRGEHQSALHLLVPDDSGRSGRGLYDLILGITAGVIVVGAVVSWAVANSVARPIAVLVDDVRQIARGNFNHRTRVRGGGEVRSLAREIDKMAASLVDAQADELDLLEREREMEVADEVREALLPEGTPTVPNYDLLALQIGCPAPGGDFYDVIEYADGRTGLLLCEVSGTGIPGALIGATARAYLSAILVRSEDVSEALRQVNLHLAKGVRRGMYVTAMYVLLDPSTNEVEVACAGHKVPLLHFVAADRKMKTVQPEGIALGFDKGPIFDRALNTARFVLQKGDRLLLSNTGPLQVQNAAGEELGEKGFYKILAKRAFDSSEELMGTIDSALDFYAEDADFPHDISVVSIMRKA
ncbi:MAG: serine phosphatase RsbU (regulator of sigma subunit) [Planctomycetota bacterium]|jgi:serine phosphatase RsbU (regulator of sigma subunit)